MLILTIRTDKPEAEIGLYENEEQVKYEVWIAHRQLAETIHQKIKALLHAVDKNLEDIEGIVVFKGPGSFTGLRIGMSVANALAYSLKIPVVGAMGDWIEQGLDDLIVGKGEKLATPEYGSEANTTPPR